ncbi:hypothetical protein L208DRAFT_1228349, partial [Tricholoma matsutake]
AYGYLNNWNPAVLHCLQANHDIKLITNGEDTKNMSFYISNYTTKKQTKSLNTSTWKEAGASNTRDSWAQKHVRNLHNMDCIDMNKKLIQCCANTLTRQQEFSSPEIESYLMGWGDHYLSHNYAPIYWDSIVQTVKKSFPEL